MTRVAHPRLFDITRMCVECERVFDLSSEDDAEEWFYGHDCEVES